MDEQTKKLLREGFYWEALRLPPGSTYPVIVRRIAEMEQSCQGDREAMVLLAQVRQDLMGNKYPPARELCDELFEKLGDNFAQPIFEKDIVTRANMWQHDFRSNISSIKSIKAQSIRTLTKGGAELNRKGCEDGVDPNLAGEAHHKSLRCIEIAQTYSDDQHYINYLDTLKASFLCNHGVDLINKAEEKLGALIKELTSDSSPWSEIILNAFDTAIAEIRYAIGIIEEARELDQHNPKIQELLETGQSKLTDIIEHKGQIGGIASNQRAMSLCNRGVERINRAQKECKTALEAVWSGLGSGGFDMESLLKDRLGRFRNMDTAVLRQVLTDPNTQESLIRILIPEVQKAQSHCISEIEAGIADIEEAKRLDPHNQHINDSLKTAKQILKDVGGQAQERSSKTWIAKPQHRVSTPSTHQSRIQEGVSTSSKRRTVALPLAIFLGWLGADRFYLRRVESAGFKLGLFILSLITILQGYAGWSFLIVVIWWLIDIILIAKGSLKDSEGNSLN